ncbi:MAG: ABC transporter permease [Acidobacteria bacterium]|nr:ABC transporter permease [Acidobacteriota bacterium]
MKAYDLFDLASRNLRESVLRNGLTTAGIAVGVASLLAMLSLGVGLQQLAGKRLSGSGLFDTIAVSPQRTSGRDRGGETPHDGEPRILDEAARQHIVRLPNVVDVQPEIRFLSEVRFRDRSHVVSVGGLAPSARDNEAFEKMQGTFFSSAAAREAILKNELAKQLNEGNPPAVIGQELVIRYAERRPLPPSTPADSESEDGSAAGDEDYGFTVVRREEKLRITGIIDNEPYGGMRSSSRAGVFIPTQLAEELNIMQASDVSGASRTGASGKTYASLMVRVSDPTKAQAVEDAIGKMGFRTFSILDASQGLRRFFTILDLFLGIFGSLALAVASLGIINTLVMAVLERRREIGIMKAIGASDKDVQKLFFAEAGAMGLAGGVAGVLLGHAIGAAINFGTGIYLQRHQLPPETVWAAPLWLIAAAISFAIVVSLVSGLYPARRAARLDPVQALRYE